LVVFGWLVAAVASCQTPGSDFSPSIIEPYPPLHGGAFSGSPVPESPDPLISYRWQTTHASDGLQIYTLRPARVWTDAPGSFANLTSLVRGKQEVTVKGKGSIRLDFGVESAAWLEFDSPDLAGNVTMSISEYNQPAIVNTGAQHPAKTREPSKYGGTYRLELNRELYEGVRFGWIHVETFSRPWHISAVRLVCQVKPTNYEGAFSSSDPLLTRIWYVGAYTVKLNLLQDYFGSILMERSDRVSFTGDAHLAQAAALAAFGSEEFIEVNLRRTAHDDNGIESYSLYWVLSLVDYYKYSGDQAGFDALVGIAREKLAHAAAIWQDPPISFFGWDERLGAGFEGPNTAEGRNAYRLLFIRACRELAWALGERGLAAEAADVAQMAKRFSQDFRNRPDWPDELGLHAAAEAINAQVADPEEARRSYAREFADPINRLSYSPFNEYFVIQALARLSRYDEALSTVRELWGGQIKYGGTCFFEVFRPSWNLILSPNDPVPNCQSGYTSLCHPWSSGVTKWLSEEVLGIKPTAPGFSSYSILPHLGRTLTQVRGTMPTPRGPISVDFNAVTGELAVTSPAGSIAMLGIPKQERAIQQISLNATVIWDGAYRKVAGIGGAHEDEQFVYLTGIQPGQYTFHIRYHGSIPECVEPSARYSASFIKEDRATRGNWPGTYGTDGYVLFNYSGLNQDQERLPDYIEAVTHRSARGGQWSSATSDDRALPSDSTPSATRKIGFLATGIPDWRYVTMTLDVKVKSERNFQIALYFLDWDRSDRRLAVELFDYDTRKLIAPVKLVSDFGGGKYLLYRYHRSCRFRVAYVRGSDAVASAIFFDPIRP
jgi:tetratricopeptide (TPR) repeat protein